MLPVQTASTLDVVELWPLKKWWASMALCSMMLRECCHCVLAWVDHKLWQAQTLISFIRMPIRIHFEFHKSQQNLKRLLAQTSTTNVYSVKTNCLRKPGILKYLQQRTVRRVAGQQRTVRAPMQSMKARRAS
jgi:hypothetical protein